MLKRSDNQYLTQDLRIEWLPDRSWDNISLFPFFVEKSNANLKTKNPIRHPF